MTLNIGTLTQNMKIKILRKCIFGYSVELLQISEWDTKQYKINYLCGAWMEATIIFSNSVEGLLKK